ncbi:hypothetical protein SRABI106_02740 [Rahnella aquatilis]|nr:hypothetical protein SRABI106_02740 [Rahnella aquatilis]
MLKNSPYNINNSVATTVLPVISNGVPTKLATASNVTGNAAYNTKGRNLPFGPILRRESSMMPVPISVNAVKNLAIKKIMPP